MNASLGSTARIAAALLSIAVIAAASLTLWSVAGVSERQIRIGRAPATLFTPAGGAGAAPVVVVAHGFSGSQGLMRPMALSLAARGYRAVTFDFLGHGRHPDPLTGDITREDGATRALMAETAAVIDYARAALATGGKAPAVALLGHSMAADIIVRAAEADGNVAATIAVSMFSPAPSAASPKNLLIITGGYEGALRAEALRIAGLSTPDPVEGVAYDTAEAGWRGTAVAEGAEHISVLYSAATFEAAADWLSARLGPPPGGGAAPDPAIAAYGYWLLALLGASVLLGWPAARLLPVARAGGGDPATGWGAFLAIAAAPAVLTPLILRALQVELLPVLVADYLAQHFAVYGALTALGMLWWRRRRLWAGAAILCPERWRPALIGAGALAGFSLIALGAPIDRFATAFAITPERAPLLIAMVLGAGLYFIADERLVRGFARNRLGAYGVSKLCFLGSLAAAIALDLERLFFLIIITPVILACFVVFGLFAAWAYRRTGEPWVGGAGVALAVAYAVAATFPVVGG